MPDPHKPPADNSNRPSNFPDSVSPDRPSPSPQNLRLRRLSMGVALGIITVIVIEAILVVLTQPLS